MIIIKTPLLLKQKIKQKRLEGRRIALVPTMGNLHDGHMKLINEAQSNADIVVVTIFVNPMQFDQEEDLVRYPRSLQEDYKKLNTQSIDFVFVPKISDIYPQGIKSTTYVYVPKISNILEGVSRPGHFRGVATIVSKLFNLVQPDIACFGEKDYQQLVLVRKIVVDMHYDIEIISVPIVRDKDGLAFSSRNHHLNTEQRKIAPNLYQIINSTAKNLISGLNLKENIFLAKQALNNKGFNKNNVQIRDLDTLSKLKKTSTHAIILVSAHLGFIRLIDNKIVKLK